MNKVHPPGPKDHLLGMEFYGRFKEDPLGTATRLKEEYGDLVYVKAGPFNWYMANHPDHVKDVLVTRSKQFAKTDAFKRVISSVDGMGLVVSEGDYWLRQRRIVQPAFNHSILAKYAEVMIDETQKVMAGWSPNATVDIAQEMTNLTLRIAAKLFFGVEVRSEAQSLGDAVTALSRAMYKEFTDIIPLPDWVPLPSKSEKREAVATIDKFIRGTIAARRESGEHTHDVLSMLIDARDTEGDGAMLTDDEVRNEAITLFNAGHDSTAAALSWCWYLLMKHPQEYARFLEQLDACSLQSQPMAVMKEVPIATWICKETMRLYPPAWTLPRQTTEELEFAGYTLEKGALVNMFAWVIQRDERFFEAPNEFRPERFSPEQEKRIHPFAWFPFGAGPRACIGRDFALMEMHLVLCTIARKFKLRLPGPQIDVQPNPLVSLEPKNGVPAVIELR